MKMQWREQPDLARERGKFGDSDTPSLMMICAAMQLDGALANAGRR